MCNRESLPVPERVPVCRLVTISPLILGPEDGESGRDRGRTLVRCVPATERNVRV